MPTKEPKPKDTIEIIRKLLKVGKIDDISFRRMHHFGGSLQGFLNYCEKVDAFQPDGNNRLLHDKLEKLL